MSKEELFQMERLKVFYIPSFTSTSSDRAKECTLIFFIYP